MARATLPLCLTLTLIGCNDSTLTATREPPSVAITEPIRDATLEEDRGLHLEAVVSDPDGREEAIAFTWRVGDAEPCSGQVSPDGKATCDTRVPVGAATLDVVLTAIDGDGLSGQDTAHYTVTPNAVPTVRVDSPVVGAPYYVDHPIRLHGVVADVESLPEHLTVLWTDDVSGALLGGPTIPASDGSTGGYVSLAEGDHVVTLSVEDEAAKVAREQVLIHVGPPNRPPTCAIVAPVGGAASVLGDPLRLRVEGADPDVAADALRVTWTSSLDGVLGDVPLTTDGEAELTVSSLSRGTHTLTATVTDDAGATCTDLVSHLVGTPPRVVLDTPAADARFRVGDPVAFRAVVSDEDSPPTALGLAWSTDVAGDLGGPTADALGVAAFSRADLPAGAHTLSLVATDPSGLATTVTRAFVVNRPPGAPQLAIAPAPATTDDQLVATFVAGSIDPDGQPVGYRFAWSRDGVLDPTLTTTTVPASATTKGQAWTVHVTPNDGMHDGPPGEATVTIADAPPAITGVVVTPDAGVRAGTSLACTATATDPDGDALTTRVTWRDASGAAIASGTPWRVEGIVPGTTVTCAATVDDGDGGTATDTATVTVLDTAPTVTNARISPSERVVPRTVLACDADVVDPDRETVRVERTWTDGTGRALGVGPALALDDAWAPIGTAVTCTVTATDTLGATDADSATVVVEDPRPQLADVTVVVVDGGPPTATATLQCVATGFVDPQGDADHSRYLWTVDGFAVGSASTLSGEFARGQRVRCTVIPSDGTWDGTPLSDELVVVDSPPRITGVTLTPARPTAASTLTCAYTGWYDADGDLDASLRTWNVAGVDLATTSPTLTGAFAAGDHVICTVTPRTADGVLGVPKRASVVVNSPPGTPDVAVVPSYPDPDDDLVCLLGASADAEGDPLTYEVEWLRNGVLTAYGAAGVPASTTPTVPASATRGNDTWTCRARASDGLATSAWASDSVDVRCPVGSGVAAECPATSCMDILLGGASTGDGLYWIDPTGSSPFQARCDMTTDGGGWTLVLQAGRGSTYTYSHRVWSDATAATPFPWDTSDFAHDYASPAFYELDATQTRLCLERSTDGAWACDTIDHRRATGTELATGPETTTTEQTTGLMPDAMRSVLPAPPKDIWSSNNFERWGWNHGFVSCGGLRVGFSGDGDHSDSRDAGIGVGFYLQPVSGNCNPADYAKITYGAGYYHYPWGFATDPYHPTPTVAPLRAQVWLR